MLTAKFYTGAEMIHECNISALIFPDGTSQVWKLNLPENINTIEYVDIQWKYESEIELIHIEQFELLMQLDGIYIKTIEVPYFPYARQDKRVSNQSCFAREWFERKLIQLCDNIKAFDMHSECFNVENKEPIELIKKSIESLQNPIIVFPDIGASNRYINIIPDDIDYIVMDKVRDQLSGKITGMKISKLVITDIKKDRTCNYDYLIVDDISDYGGTFKLVSSVLKSELTNINTINLYVSHLLGHGGLQSLHDAGISKVFTSDSLTEYRKSKNLLADEVIFNIK